MNTFFEILNQDLTDAQANFHIKLNKNHPVYAGHFPNMAVAPGVMLTEMIGDLTAGVVNKKLILSKARNIKFMAPVLPNQQDEMQVKIDFKQTEEGVAVKAVANFEDQTYFKISANFNEA